MYWRSLIERVRVMAEMQAILWFAVMMKAESRTLAGCTTSKITREPDSLLTRLMFEPYNEITFEYHRMDGRRDRSDD
jgi:hypothetical protein